MRRARTKMVHFARDFPAKRLILRTHDTGTAPALPNHFRRSPVLKV
jgi:hypothetical protein